MTTRFSLNQSARGDGVRFPGNRRRTAKPQGPTSHTALSRLAQPSRKYFLLLILLLCAFAGRAANALRDFPVTQFGAVADDAVLDTAAIQQAIDACAAAGGGTVRVPQGRFLAGGLRLKDHVYLFLEAGSLLQGSTNCADYGGQPAWGDALLTARNANDLRIEGPGTIDGADCRNPKGEEGFRGPHAIFLTACTNIVIEGVTITRAGNYAVLCRDSVGAEIRRVTVRGGHDGLHAQACRQFNVRDCDFRTGDDCLAGCDNHDFAVTGCQINSSCNGFRLGCDTLLVKDCRLWGPGEFQHQISRRTNMLAAFVHFAPKDRKPRWPSDHWLIQNVTIENADTVYGYDFERGLWQTGQPAQRLRFQNVKATGLAKPLRALGDTNQLFELTLENVSLALRPDKQAQEVINVSRFGSLVLSNVTLQNRGDQPVLRARDGRSVVLDRITTVPPNSAPFVLEKVSETRTNSAAGSGN